MKAFVFLVIAHLCVSSAFGVETCGSVTEALETACNFPTPLTLTSSPKKLLVDETNCNSEYPKGEWQDQPIVNYPDAKPDKMYTLVNVDPDPPSYPKGQYYLHWLVSNIKGDDFIKGDLSKANHLTAYYGPAPPAGSGLHRYMFLAFEQEAGNQTLENPAKRAQFEFVPWVQRQEKLCGPVAGVQFRTKF